VKATFAWTAAVILVGSCRFAPLRNRDDPTMGLAFGRIEATGTPLNITHVVLRRYDAVSFGGPEGIRRTHTTADGFFYSHNLDPGRYAVVGFYSTAGNYYFRPMRECCLFDVRSGDVSYAGTYRVMIRDRGGEFSFDERSFSRADSLASELEILDWLASKELVATDWAPLARARVDKLRASARHD
jgi:hypothetical protein